MRVRRTKRRSQQRKSRKCPGGCSARPARRSPSFSSAARSTSTRSSIQSSQRALEYGVDYFDAARVYGGGRCEPAIANFLQRTKKRDKVWITSKSPEHEPDGFARDLDKSLKDLKTDRVDLYFLHALKDKKYLSKEMGNKAEELKKSGKMKHFGFSCHHGTCTSCWRRRRNTAGST